MAQAEAALVEHYPRLVRLAYVTLPADLGKHHRAMAAHRLVQSSLPTSPVPSRQGGAFGVLRVRVLRAALEFADRGRLRAALDGVRSPRVTGLRTHPQAGGEAEAALYRALSSLPAPARAAYALMSAEALGEPDARGVLDAAGVADPREAVRAAAGVRVPAQAGTGTAAGAVPGVVTGLVTGAGVDAGAGLGLGAGRGAAGRAQAEAAGPVAGRRLLASGEFDACTLQLRPTDLLRRRRRGRIAGVAAAVAAAGALLFAVAGSGSSNEHYAASGTPGADPRALDPAALVRVPANGWKSTARLDFSAWPARGDRTKDTALLGRALSVWANPGASVDVSSTPGTPRTGPTQPPQLLFAGDEDAATVVIFYDGLRVVRYAQPKSGSGRAALDFAQAQDADPTTSAALLVDRVDGNARFLTAPWVAGARTRDLFEPGQATADLHRSSDGVTDPVPMPGVSAAADATGSAACGTTWPVMELRSSAAIGTQQSFLLTDLGDLAPVHLTYSPPSAVGGAVAPREATGSQALASWAHSACRLVELRGQGVKAVDDWEFADTALPEGAGEASWTCDRADTWRGPGIALVQFVPPAAKAAEPGTLAGQQADGNACSRYDQHVMAGVMWKSPADRWYLLAAGSRDTASITATNGVQATSEGQFLSAPAPRGTRATLDGRLADGTPLSPLGDG
ncbi:hypothetical protein [Actinacidiphila reveromycinica]|uniref:hypothetical protein n=1 Tax=Actinacidiphila reveromycinica TaxID=659352 RepID=UPI001F203390|nr:hypothetical protein [Streptomyces sp. SN-593]